MSWQDAPLPVFRAGPLGWLRVLWRGTAMSLVTYGGLVLLLLARLVEAPLFGPARPFTPRISQFVCRTNCTILGLRRVVRGRPMAQKGAVVANHSSWLDIFTLNACDRVYFVAKAEVSGWPGIGWLARATGTVFIRRKGVDAKVQQDIFETRLRQGHRLLFQAFFTHGLDRVLFIQPVTVVYHAPEGQDARFYGWWGDMDFAGHLWKMLAAPRHGHVEIVFHPEVPVDGFEDRKALAQHCERVIRTSHLLAVE